MRLDDEVEVVGSQSTTFCLIDDGDDDVSP